MPNFVKIGQVVPENKIFKFLSRIFTISLLSLRAKLRGLSFEQTWIPFIKGFYVPNLAEIGPVVMAKKMTPKKFTDRQMGDGEQAIRKVRLSFQLRWANTYKIM